METSHYDMGKARVIPLTGEFDLSNSAALEESIRASINGHPHVVVDLTATQYIDSTVLSVLVRLHRDWGARVCFALPSSGVVHRIIEVSGLRDHLAVYDTLEAAIAG